MQVKQRVTRKGKTDFKRGVISEIHGEPQAHKVRDLNSAVIYRQGDAQVDIIFEDGSVQNNVFEREIIGAAAKWSWFQFTLLNEFASDEELDYLQNHAQALKEIRDLAEEAKKWSDARGAEQLKKDYPYLVPLDKGLSSSAAASKNLKLELKHTFPGVKFSVVKRSCTYSYSLDVEWNDGPAYEAVDKIANKYQHSDFDGMTDSDVPRNNLWNKVFGGARFVFCRRKESEAS